MIRLHLFGERDILGPDGKPITAVLDQPKQFAVLAYFALAGYGRVRSRDTALTLFWPDATESRARHGLNQTIHCLRQSLGRAAVISRGRAEVGLSEDLVWCDATAFERALTCRRSADALDLYRGELLPGFFIAAGPEFDHWLTDQRARFRRSAAEAAWLMAQSAERAGELRNAAEWARKALDVSLNDEASFQKLLRLLDRIDDRVGALWAYDTFRLRLEREYDIRPSAETQQLIADIRARGERQRTSFQEQAGQSARPHGATDNSECSTIDAPVSSEALSAPVRVERMSSRFVRRAVLPVALACGVGWGLRHHVRSVEHMPRGQRTNIRVEPIAALDTSLASVRFGRALADGVVHYLANINSFDVTVSERASAQPHSGESAGSTSAGLRLSGNMVQSPSGLHVAMRISDPVSGRVIRTLVLEDASGDQLSFLNLASRQVSVWVRTTAGREARRRERVEAVGGHQANSLMQRVDADIDIADELEQSGNLASAARSLLAADSVLANIERIAPNSVQPMIERAAVFQRLGAMYVNGPIADTALARGYFSQGLANANRALRRDARNSAALESAGALSYWYSATAPLPLDSALMLLAYSERMLYAALAVDPNKASAWSALSTLLFARADYAGAQLAAEHAYRSDAYLEHSEAILRQLWLTSYEIGNEAGSRQWCDELNGAFPHAWEAAYCRLALLAWNPPTAAAKGVIPRVWAAVASTRGSTRLSQASEPHLRVLAAAVLARYGMQDSAEAVLRRTAISNSHDPELAPLEAHARLLLGQENASAVLLKRYALGGPLHRAGTARSRRFAALTNLQRQLTELNIGSKTR